MMSIIKKESVLQGTLCLWLELYHQLKNNDKPMENVSDPDGPAISC